MASEYIEDIKFDLSMHINELIKDNKLTQIDASKIASVSQERISNINTYQVEKFSIEALLDILAKLTEFFIGMIPMYKFEVEI
jgi:predicted XRE-type DNA-binding protein